jgi:hypothetical protein
MLTSQIKGSEDTIWKGILPQYFLNFAYADLYGNDNSTCIVGDFSITNPATSILGTPTITYCDAKYEVSTKTIKLPRNTIPICAYYPPMVVFNAISYRAMIAGYTLVDKPPSPELKQHCLNELSVSSKSRFKNMYGVDVHDTACMRYAELVSLAYGSDPEIKEIAQKIEGLITKEVKWRDSTLQANMIIGVVCVAINKGTCIKSWEHILSEKDNSILSLLGFNIKQTPTTWLYADGIDIELLHNFVEIMGMDLQTTQVNNIYYHHISTNAPTGQFTRHAAGLLGGPPKIA